MGLSNSNSFMNVPNEVVYLTFPDVYRKLMKSGFLSIKL